MARTKSKSREQPSSEPDSIIDIDDDVDEEEVFHVEVITKARVTELKPGVGGWEYFIKWANYPDSDSSWEPTENVKHCDRLLDSFWDHVGSDEKDYDIGYEVHAKMPWILKEKEFFAKTFNLEKDKPEEKDQENTVRAKGSKGKKQKELFKTEISRKGKQKQNATITIDTSDDDDKPLQINVSRPKLKSRKRERQSSSEEDRPSKVRKGITGLHAASSSKSSHSAIPIRKPSPLHDLFSDRESSPEAPLSSQPKVARSSLTQIKTVSKPVPRVEPSASGSSRIATKGIPLHRQRQSNPRVKMLPSLPTVDIGISTKSRLARPSPIIPAPIIPSPIVRSPIVRSPIVRSPIVRSPIVPSPIVPTPIAPAPIIPAHKKSGLNDLKFKKIPKEASESIIPAVPTRSNQMKWAPPEPEPFTTQAIPAPFNNREIAAPSSAPGLESFTQEELPPDEHVGVPSADVEDFLTSIMPKGFDDPLRPIDESNKPEPVTGTITKVKPAAMSKIPKKWKWSGELFLSVSDETATRLCEVTIQDPSDIKADGMRFNLFFQTINSLRLKKLHDITDLNMILQSCAPDRQFASLIPQDDKDKDALETLSKYMSCRGKFTYAPLSFANAVKLETDIAAFILVFPPLNDLCERLSVPHYMRQVDGLLVSLLPLKFKSSKYEELQWYNPTLPQLSRKDANFIFVSDSTLKEKPAYVRALRLLRFPKWLLDFLCIMPRRYCIWPASVDGTTTNEEENSENKRERQALITILNENHASDAGCKEVKVRVVFVHVRAVETLYRLNSFSWRRRKTPQQFITYGSHFTVPRERWGFREIYILGGIVTFTPNAIINDPLAVLELISLIGNHPSFDCYILPAVVGLILGLAEERNDVAIREFILEDLSKLVDEQKVMIVAAPPKDMKGKLAWGDSQLVSNLKGATNILAECRASYNRKYANMSAGERQRAILDEISNDMLLWQLEPAVMDEYRRFVVITHRVDGKERESKSPDELQKQNFDYHDWLEWQTVSSFKFNDDYYPGR